MEGGGGAVHCGGTTRTVAGTSCGVAGAVVGRGEAGAGLERGSPYVPSHPDSTPPYCYEQPAARPRGHALLTPKLSANRVGSSTSDISAALWEVVDPSEFSTSSTRAARPQAGTSRGSSLDQMQNQPAAPVWPIHGQ